MTAYLPRVGDTITTAAQVRDLPTGVVVRTHNGILCEADGVGLVTPSWYAQGRALEARHLPATVLYVPGDRPSVTDNARAAIRALAQHQFAEPLPFGVVCTCGEDIGEWNRPSWAASISGRALAFAAHQFERMHAATEPYDPECVDCQGTGMATLNPDEEPGSHSCRRAAGRAETTTATTEEAFREQVGRAVGGVLWNASNHPSPVAVLGKDIGPMRSKVVDAVMDVLASARTLPTRDDLILALAQADGQAWPDGMDDHTANHMYGKQADAVLALLGGDES